MDRVDSLEVPRILRLHQDEFTVLREFKLNDKNLAICMVGKFGVPTKDNDKPAEAGLFYVAGNILVEVAKRYISYVDHNPTKGQWVTMGSDELQSLLKLIKMIEEPYFES
jgi:hypothetical protein